MRTTNIYETFELLTSDQTVSNDITGICACDLLSHVMANSKEGEVLITVLNNINVLGVASLLDLSCVIFSYGVVVDESIIQKANDLEIPLFRSELPTAEVVLALKELGV